MLRLWRYLPSSLARSGARRRATLADPQAAASSLEELNAELAGLGGELTEPPAQAGGAIWPLAAQSLPAAADAAAPRSGAASCGCGGCGCRRALHVHVHIHSPGGGQWELPASALTADGGSSTAAGVGGGGAGGGDTHVHVHLPPTTLR